MTTPKIVSASTQPIRNVKGRRRSSARLYMTQIVHAALVARLFETILEKADEEDPPKIYLSFSAKHDDPSFRDSAPDGQLLKDRYRRAFRKCFDDVGLVRAEWNTEYEIPLKREPTGEIYCEGFEVWISPQEGNRASMEKVVAARTRAEGQDVTYYMA